MRRALLGVTLAFAAAGCGAADDRSPPIEKNPEYVASTSQSLAPPPAQVNCNDQSHVTTPFYAVPLGTDGSGNPVYQRSVSALLTDLSSTACTSNYGATACRDWYNYTQAIYGQVYGAAGYYYRVGVPMATDGGQVMKYWISIPILDSTTSSPGYYYNYPGASVIHTPLFAPPVYNASYATTQSPFWLHSNDYTNLTSVVGGTLNTPNVQGVMYAQCVAILDQNGHFLDYNAVLELYDPNGCGGCAY